MRLGRNKRILQMSFGSIFAFEFEFLKYVVQKALYFRHQMAETEQIATYSYHAVQSASVCRKRRFFIIFIMWHSCKIKSIWQKLLDGENLDAYILRLEETKTFKAFRLLWKSARYVLAIMAAWKQQRPRLRNR